MPTPDDLTFDILRSAVETAAAFRCRRRLQPAGGEGDKVFPPTFAGAVYAIEKRRVPGRGDPVQCVLLDSVQSQANRMEQALQDAIDAGMLKLPHVVVDFSEHDPREGGAEQDGKLIDAVGKVTSLQVPHRLVDAIIRDSTCNGKRFRDSDKGKALNRVSLANATPLFEMCPTALVFGMWDSTGPKGGLGPKFERAMVSEIVGVGAEWNEDYRARGVRRDPLEIRAAVKVMKGADKSWRLAPTDRWPSEEADTEDMECAGRSANPKVGHEGRRAYVGLAGGRKRPTMTTNFTDILHRATENPAPPPYQERLALEDTLPSLLDVPTGRGKAAAARRRKKTAKANRGRP